MDWTSTLDVDAQADNTKASEEKLSGKLKINSPEKLTNENLEKLLKSKYIIQGEEKLSRSKLLRLYNDYVEPLPRRKKQVDSKLQEGFNCISLKDKNINNHSRLHNERKRKMASTSIEGGSTQDSLDSTLKTSSNLTVRIPSSSNPSSKISKPIKIKRKTYESSLKTKQEKLIQDKPEQNQYPPQMSSTANEQQQHPEQRSRSFGGEPLSTYERSNSRSDFYSSNNNDVDMKNMKSRRVFRSDSSDNMDSRYVEKRVIEIEDDRLQNAGNLETIKVSFGNGSSLRSSIVVSKNNDNDDVTTGTPIEEKQHEKIPPVIEQSNFHGNENENSDKHSKEKDGKEKSDDIVSGTHSTKHKGSTTQTDHHSKETSHRDGGSSRRSVDRPRKSSVERRKDRSHSRDNYERRHSHNSSRRNSQRSPPPARRRSPYRPRYQPMRRDYNQRWAPRGRFDQRRGGRYGDHRGRGWGRGYNNRPYGNHSYNNNNNFNNNRVDTRRRSRDRSTERRDRSAHRRRSEEAPRKQRRDSTSSTSSSSSSSESDKDKTNKKAAAAAGSDKLSHNDNEKKLSKEEKDKIMKELQEIEQKKFELKKNRRSKKQVESEEKNSVNIQPTVNTDTITVTSDYKEIKEEKLERSIINVAIHSTNEKSNVTADMRSKYIPPVDTFKQSIEKYKSVAMHAATIPPRDQVAPPEQLHRVERIHDVEFVPNDQDGGARNDAYGDINENFDKKKKKRKKSKKKKHRKRSESGDSESNMEVSQHDQQMEMFESNVNTSSHGISHGGNEHVHGEVDSSQTDQADMQSDREAVASSASENEDESSEPTGDDDANSSDSSEDESEEASSSENEQSARKKSKKKLKSKKKKKKREMSSSSEEGGSSSDAAQSSSDEESSEEENKRRKKKRKKKKKKRSSKKHKSSKKSSKKNKAAVLFDPQQLMTWMIEQKEKMREEILNEVKSATSNVKKTPPEVQSENNVVTVDKRQSKKRIGEPFDELAKEGGKDAEIADDVEIEMEKEDGYLTGILLKKDEKQESLSATSNVSPAHVAHVNDDDREEVFSLFKSDDDELDYDDLERDSTEEENWKRRTSREKDSAALNNVESSQKRHTTSSKRRRSRSPKESSRVNNRRQRDKEQQSSGTRKREHKREDSNREPDRKAVKNSEDSSNVKVSSESQSTKSTSRRDDKKNGTNKPPPPSTQKKREDHVERRPRHRSSDTRVNEQKPPLKEKVSVEKFDTFKLSSSAQPHDQKYDNSRIMNPTQRNIEKYRSGETTADKFKMPPIDNIKYPSGFITSNSVPTTISPASNDGIAYANQVRDKAVKRDDFWKGDKLKRTPPINPADIFDSGRIEAEVVSVPKANVAVSRSEGHWEAPFSSNSQLNKNEPVKQLYDSDVMSRDMSRMLPRDDGRKPNAVEYTKIDSTLHSSPHSLRGESKRYSENIDNSNTRRTNDLTQGRKYENERRFTESRDDLTQGRKYENERRFTESRDDLTQGRKYENERRFTESREDLTQSRKYENERRFTEGRDMRSGDQRKDERMSDSKRNIGDEYRNRSSYQQKDPESRFHSSERKEVRSEYRPHDIVGRDYKRTDSYVKHKDVIHGSERLRHSPVNNRTDNRPYVKNDPKYFRDKMNKSVDYREILNRKKDSTRIFSPNSTDSDNEQKPALISSSSSSSHYTRPEKNYRSSKRR